VRAKIKGTPTRPRLVVTRTVKHILAQLVDDTCGATLILVSDDKLKGTKSEKAYQVGHHLAQEALKKKIKRAIFDRRHYKFHGRVAALAQGARKGGLEF
jgi:large subunit ribosomal protein L18